MYIGLNEMDDLVVKQRYYGRIGHYDAVHLLVEAVADGVVVLLERLFV
jgi:hypothetical protein